MDSRERITRILNLEEPDRIGYVDEVNTWPETLDRWEKEGMPDIRRCFLNERFGMDICGIEVLRNQGTPMYVEMVYEVLDEGTQIMRDRYGAKIKSWKGKWKSGPPYLLEPAVRNLEDFKEKIEPLLDPEEPRRISSSRYPFRYELERAVRRLQKRFFVLGRGTGPHALGVWENAQRILGGIAPTLIHMKRNPTFVKYIFDTIANLHCEIYKAIIDAGFDGLWFSDDLGYGKGPFFSIDDYRKLLLPAHRKICAPFEKKGLPRILHTDGNVMPLIPAFIEAGFTGLQPLEVKAGMDVRELKELYGDKLALMGNIDVQTLSSNNLENIKKEVLSKIKVAGQGGGYIISSDHSVPPSVSLQNYQFFLKVAMKHGRYPL